MLTEGLKGALFAASSDETKQILTGVHLTGTADSLEFAATDGHRLSVVETILPPKTNEEDEAEETIEVPNLEGFPLPFPHELYGN